MTNKDSLKNSMFEFAFNEALNDATSRVYAGKDKLVFEHPEIKDIVKEYIDGIFSNGKGDPIECIDNIANIKGMDTEFGFGKIQKLVNMTAKYMYIGAAYGCDELRNRFKDCHCPLDSYILSSLNEEDVCWSTLDKDDYCRCQEKIKNKSAYRMEYDLINWDKWSVINAIKELHVGTRIKIKLNDGSERTVKRVRSNDRGECLVDENENRINPKDVNMFYIVER